VRDHCPVTWIKALVRSAAGALQPGPEPFAVAAALRILLAASVVALFGATGDLRMAAVAFLGSSHLMGVWSCPTSCRVGD